MTTVATVTPVNGFMNPMLREVIEEGASRSSLSSSSSSSSSSDTPGSLSSLESSAALVDRAFSSMAAPTRASIASARKDKKQNKVNAKAAKIAASQAKREREAARLTGMAALHSATTDAETSVVDNGKIYFVKGVNIKAIKFSQDSIGDRTSEGTPLTELVENMATKGWKKGTQLRIVRTPDGSLVSMDNRRLWAAKAAAEKATAIGQKFMIQVREFSGESAVSKALLESVTREYVRGRGTAARTDAIAKGVILNSNLHALKLRMHARVGELNSPGFGYTETTVRSSSSSSSASASSSTTEESKEEAPVEETEE